MSFLIDTNILSELRKGPRADPRVVDWLNGVHEEELFLSVVVIGELRKGIENVRRRDAAGAIHLEAWLRQVLRDHQDRILPITVEIAEVWGVFNVPDPLPVIDSLLAATAHVHGLVLVTRNVKDVVRTGVPVLNPFASA